MRTQLARLRIAAPTCRLPFVTIMKRRSSTSTTDATRPDKRRMTTALLQLTPTEERLRGLLLDVAESINNSHKPSARDGQGISPREPVILRWAGGWVRDKLLGIVSHDIDVAINCMTGEDFGNALGQFCTQPSVIEKYSITTADLGSLHTIRANPEKSKNLATATRRVLGMDLDFVNLRKETYSDNSRNPQVEFGTAAEDALRRDATVNALFYNIHTGEVEDLVGGLSDLKAKLIRTPLEPLQTFTDDPLRVLRLVRFASRLGFSIDPETEKFMADDRVLKSLRVKISRERVGIEVEKMLKGEDLRVTLWYSPCSVPRRLTPTQGKHPKDALELIDRLGLYHTIFTDPGSEQLPVPDISTWKAVYGFHHSGVVGEEFTGPLYARLVRGDEEAYIAWALTALTPWNGVENPNKLKEKPRLRSIPLIVRAAREGIKATSKLCAMVTAAHANRREILELKGLVCAGKGSSTGRDVFGMAIRRWNNRSENWRLQVFYTILVEAMEELGDWPPCLNRKC
jgi:tRNA nucleotidyltransferase (CCA-adding enzyme)